MASQQFPKMAKISFFSFFRWLSYNFNYLTYFGCKLYLSVDLITNYTRRLTKTNYQKRVLKYVRIGTAFYYAIFATLPVVLVHVPFHSVFSLEFAFPCAPPRVAQKTPRAIARYLTPQTYAHSCVVPAIEHSAKAYFPLSLPFVLVFLFFHTSSRNACTSIAMRARAASGVLYTPSTSSHSPSAAPVLRSDSMSASNPSNTLKIGSPFRPLPLPKKRNV